MAYNHQMEQMIISAITIATGQGVALTAADLGVWAPSQQPIEIRGVAVIMTTTATTTAPVIDFYFRPTAGSDTNRVLLKRLNPALASWAAGNVIYADVDSTSTLSQVITPGGDVIAECSTAPAAGNGHMCIMFESNWENPANNSRMIKVA